MRICCMATSHSASLYVVGGRMRWQRAQFSLQSCEPPLVCSWLAFDSVAVAELLEVAPDALSSAVTRPVRKRPTTSAAMDRAATAFRIYETFVFIGKISRLEAHRSLQKVRSDVFVPIIRTTSVASFECGLNDGAWA